VNGRLADLYALAQGDVLDDVLAVFIIKTAMLVFGIMEISIDSHVDKNRVHHLKLEPVWDAAHRLLVFFHDITEGLNAGVEEIEEKYDSFLQILRTIPDAPLPVSYTQLMKQAGNIRRPYHAQAIAIISLCRFLARHYESLTEDQRTATNVEPLEEACQETLAALQVAAATVTTLRTFDMNAPENARVGQAFIVARTKIQDCFNHFGLTDHWAHYEKIFQQAAEKDRSRAAQLSEVLASRPSRIPDGTADLVRVNVDVRDGSPAGTIIKSFSLSAERETRLRALRWYISKALESRESTRVLRDSSFLVRKTADSPEGDSLVPCRMHTSIEDVTPASVCDLVLVIS